MNIKQNDIIILEGRTLKGKNRIREHGNKWRVIRIADASDNVVRIFACQVGNYIHRIIEAG